MATSTLEKQPANVKQVNPLINGVYLQTIRDLFFLAVRARANIFSDRSTYCAPWEKGEQRRGLLPSGFLLSVMLLTAKYL